MSADKAKRSSQGGASPAPTSESLEQVRDILFGAQMRSVEARLSQLEERMKHELDQLQGAFDEKVAKLEQGLRKELGAEREGRAAALESLRVAQGEATTGLAGDLDALRVATAESDGALRDELASEIQRWEAALDRIAAEVRSELGAVAADLGARKPDAHHLAELFRDLVRRLEQPNAADE